MMQATIIIIIMPIVYTGYLDEGSNEQKQNIKLTKAHTLN